MRRSAAPDPDDRSWQDLANCLGVDPDVFFPFDSHDEDLAAAKAICAECSVRRQCLEYALTTRQDAGVWGGKSERERRRIRRSRRQLQLAPLEQTRSN